MTTTTQFINSLGINTHIDFPGVPSVATHIAAINYLGVKHIRDCAQHATTPALWHTVMNGTGAKFLAFMPEGSPATVQAAFDLLPALYTTGCVTMVEGPNEEDDAYAASGGNSTAKARQFQIDHMAPWAKQWKKPLVNISFGAGWTAANGWKGDYDKVGDMAPYCDYANAHTYPPIGFKTTATMAHLNDLARLAASRPVMTTEIGWDRNQGYTEAEIAKFTIQAAFAGTLLGNPMTYFYALFDDAARFGMMNADGTPRPAATALHKMMAFLSAAGAPKPYVPLSYGIDQLSALNDHVVVLDAPDGSHFLAIWNETDPPRSTRILFPTPRFVTTWNAVSGELSASAGPVLAYPITVSDDVLVVKIY